jgi:hypothetical protein
MMKKKFSSQNIDEIILEDFDGTEYKLDALYNCKKIIGVGGFGFVVEAMDN